MPTGRRPNCFVSATVYGFVWLAAAGCDETGLKPPPGDPCVKNSDCKDPLSCTIGLCHEACQESRDCPTGQTCVRVTPDDAKAINVCQLAVEKACVHSSDCDGQLRCASDFQCRTECEQPKDCPTKSQKCVENVCAEPVDTMTSKDTSELALKPGTPPLTSGQARAGNGAVAGSAGHGGSAAGIGGASGSGAGSGRRGGAGGSKMETMVSAATADPPAPQCDGEGGFKGFHPSNLPAELKLPDDIQPLAGPGCLGFSTNDTDQANPMSTGPHWASNCGGLPVATSRVVKLTDGREAAVLFVEAFTLATSSTFSFTGDRPLIIVATGRVEINGAIHASADPVTGWFGGGAPSVTGASRPGRCPIDDAPGGGRPGSSDYATGIGAGGGSFCGRGGAGSTDLKGTARPAGGEPYGADTLTPLVGGSSGGTGADDPAGHGGAAIQIVSATEILIGDNGRIIVPGGGGSGASGAGSGGAILLEAPTVTVRGVLAANGGAGCERGYGAAAEGQASDQPALPPSVGGRGSAGDAIDGAPGNADGTTLDDASGGGGAGRIRINTGCAGKLTVTSSAIISPHQGTQCFSEGPLR